MIKINPKLDLVLERTVDVSPELVWMAWTQPQHLKKWFTPAPWTTTECEIDLRPGGLFRAVMRSPEGETFPSLGCYLETVPHQKLVWTDALVADYRPAPMDPKLNFHFTGMVLLEPHGKGTKYTAMAIHTDAESCKKHDEMGFHTGWGKALDQLVAHMKTVRA